MTGFLALLALTRTGFTAPSYAIFTDLLTGWVCAPGRRTITNMIAVADPAGRRAHDAYHRFVRDGVWSMSRLWRALSTHLLASFCPTGVVELACDDTLFHHEGSKVKGAGVFRDAVRSTLRRVVYARGLNLVVITLTITPPWGGQPIAVPVNVRVHRKHDETTTIAHAAAMLTEILGWFPDRWFHLCADGAYATLAGAALPRPRSPPGCAATPLSMRPHRRGPGDAGGHAPRASGSPPPRHCRRACPSDPGARSMSTSAAGPSNAWSMSVTCSGTR